MLRELGGGTSYTAETISEPRSETLSMVIQRVGDEYKDAARDRANADPSGFEQADAQYQMRMWQFVLLSGIRDTRQSELMKERGIPVDLSPGVSVRITSFNPQAEHMPLGELSSRLATTLTDFTLLENDEGGEEIETWKEWTRDLINTLPQLAQPR